MIDNPLVSIIVPVYNVKTYIKQCLDSLVAINYQPKEIIVVDDCSTDGSLDICRMYMDSHPGLKLIRHIQNKGAQAARITGVNNACGDYVMFVDSDDYVDPEILNHLVTNAVQFNADIVCAQFYRSIDGNKQLEKRSVFGVFNKAEIKELFFQKLIIDESLYKAGMPLYLCGKLFKKTHLLMSLYKGIELRYGEDELAVIDFLMNYTETLVCIESSLYYYRSHPSQVTAKTLTELWPDFLLLWDHLDELNTWSWDTVLSRRMWCFLKPSIYLRPLDEKPTKFVYAMKQLRNASIVKKHIFNNSNISSSVKKHPHYLLLKYRLYWLDYLMYFLIWLLPKR
jgi:glycosyltransferase involved in cell wall biosynthesis